MNPRHEPLPSRTEAHTLADAIGSRSRAFRARAKSAESLPGGAGLLRRPTSCRALRYTLTSTALHALLVATPASAQDAASVDGSIVDANLAAAATVGRDAAATPRPAPSGGCQSDPIPSGHEIRVETIVAPTQPTVGDRVIITYRLIHHPHDEIEFEPDPATFAQPGNEVEYAREQPSRDRTAHAAPGGRVYGDVSVAVQPFKTGDVVFPPQLARLNAAGDVVRVCTPELRFRVRDPFGNEPHPAPLDVTAPEAVSIDALRWRWIALALDAIFAVVVATLLVSAYVRSRPKVAPPPPPPRPPWIVAIEALGAIARSDLLSRGQTKDYYDAISDVVRRYAGASRGFDALEMTTDEVLRRMRRTPLSGVAPAEVEHLLRECDLVKFARYVPSHGESEAILSQAYAIVRRSSPVTTRPQSAAGGETR